MPSELAQQFLRSLVEQLAAAPAAPRRPDRRAGRRAATARRARAAGTAGPTACPAGRAAAPGRRATAPRSRAERRLVDRDRHDDVQIVAVAAEQRVRLDLHRDVQIAGLAAVAPTLPLAGTRTRAPSASPAGMLTVSGFGPHLAPLPPHASHSARPLPAAAAAVRDSCGEHHVAARRLRPAPRPGRRRTRRSSTRVAPVPATRRGSVSCRVTVTVPLRRRGTPPRTTASMRLMQIGAALGGRGSPAALPSDVGEQIAEGRRRDRAAARPRSRTLRSRPLRRLVPGAQLRRRRSAAGARDRSASRTPRDLAELRGRRAVTRIDVRMIPARQPPVRALDLASRSRRARHRG